MTSTSKLPVSRPCMKLSHIVMPKTIANIATIRTSILLSSTFSTHKKSYIASTRDIQTLVKESREILS